jgi:phosphoenolpyruvate carboxylase
LLKADKRELYRRVLGHIQQRLLATVRWCEAELFKNGVKVAKAPAVATSWPHQEVIKQREELMRAGAQDVDSEYGPTAGDPNAPLFDSKELMKMLIIMHESLVSGGYADVADGMLVDIIRKVATFGLTLVPLDLRQESTRHTMALDAVTRHLGIGSYASWDEQTRINWLQAELSSKRPLFRCRDLPSFGFDDNVMDTFNTIDVASSLGPGSLGESRRAKSHAII